MVSFEDVYVTPRVRVALRSIFAPAYARKFWELVNKLRAGRFDIPGLRVEKLKTRKGKLYSARINVELRVIFSMVYNENKKATLVIWDANHHDAAYNRLDRAVVPAMFSTDAELVAVETWGEGASPITKFEKELPENADMAAGNVLFKIPHFVLAEPHKFSAFEKNIDRYLKLSEEQEDLIKNADKAMLVRGPAGTGKTSLALFHALNLYEQNPDNDIYFFTYHEELACVCRSYKVNLVGEEEGAHSGKLQVFSYLEFCRHYLRKAINSSEIKWKWVGKDVSIRYLTEILQSKQKWAKTLKAEDIYSYIYSILKGRFVPGTEQLPSKAEDFRRIFKGYGTVPENIEEILEIFGHYDERLARMGQKDEADLIRYCYQSIKKGAVLSESEKHPWIVIDEIQDFTELEWKSILLFWENHSRSTGTTLSYPFLTGDRNQNISRSGFRWQEADSYIESILKELHRPNAVEKVVLHNNFRNTKEIFQLGSLIRDAAPEASADLGKAPTLEGRKPVMVVGKKEEFARFLKSVNKEEETLPAPLVILFEDIAALEKLKKDIPDDDGLFMLPLRTSKGMEFEDLIIYRLFSSTDPNAGQDVMARLFDLWYMAVTRARQNLLLFITPEDALKIKDLFGDKFPELLERIDFKQGDADKHLQEFFENREKYLPNYTVVFLERSKAQECWDEYRADQTKTALKDKALKLWLRCRDYGSLGKAYIELSQFELAITYLEKAGLFEQVGFCYEGLGKFKEAAKIFADAAMSLDAARCYEKCNEYVQAAQIYEKHQQWLQAATNFYLAEDRLKAAQCFEKAEIWQSAADLYRSKSQWAKAAELYHRSGQYVPAAEMYLKIKDKLDAAKCYALGGEFEQAAKLHEYLNRWVEAAECYERAELFDAAGKMYTKGGRLKDAARCEEKSGDYIDAAIKYERMKNWEKAGESYSAAGQLQKALDNFESAKNWQKALEVAIRLEDWMKVGRCLENLGELEQAADNYVLVEAFNEAAYCWEKAGNWTQAADFYLKAQNFGAAASMLTKLDRRVDAARLYLLAGQVQVAMEMASKGPHAEDIRRELAEWAEATQQIAIAGQIFESLGEHQTAADKYKSAMMFDEAIQCQQRANRHDLAAELYLQIGKFEEAAECYKTCKDWRKAAQCYELIRKWDEARKMYEQIKDDEGIKRCQTAANWL
jgi:Txe/YoeB family toxin of Txe-Axe toxin-antitoxin module